MITSQNKIFDNCRICSTKLLKYKLKKKIKLVKIGKICQRRLIVFVCEFSKLVISFIKINFVSIDVHKKLLACFIYYS